MLFKIFLVFFFVFCFSPIIDIISVHFIFKNKDKGH